MSDLTSLFFYGTLRYAPLLEAVLGRAVAVQSAEIKGHAVRQVAGEPFPILVKAPDAVAEGVLAPGLSAEDRARLDYYEGPYHYTLTDVVVETEGGRLPAQVYRPGDGLWQAGDVWDLADWAQRLGPASARAAVEFMGGYGSVSPKDAARRYPQMLMRASSALRAEATPAPTTLRHDAEGAAIDMITQRRPHTGYFSVSMDDLRFPRFDGGMSEVITREAFLMADATTVVPYDPVRDRVLLIEQYRYGVHMRGDPHPWCLEPIAGRIDPGETPEQAIRREAVEEAGLTLGTLHPCGNSYPSPGAVSEYLYSFVGIADLPDDAAGLGGLATEQEDIRAHVIPFERLMDMTRTGEVATTPLLMTAYWLALNRAALA
ncbi:MAG: NUDIX domain-containing protein [Pseudomonadota bacterium]